MKATEMIILLLWLVAGLATATAQDATTEPPQKRSKVLASPSGRYQFGQISEYRRDQYVFDTQTGRLWQIAMSPDSLLVLQPIPYRSPDGLLSPTPR